MLVAFHETHEAIYAKLLLSRVCRLGDAVGIEYVAVTGLERKLKRFVAGLPKHSKKQSIFQNLVGFTGGVAPLKHRRMSCAGISHEIVFKVHVDVSGCDEVLSELSTERAIQTYQNLGRLCCVASLPSQRNLQHRGDERGGEAVAGNICDKDTYMLVVNLDEIVKIACHR